MDEGNPEIEGEQAANPGSSEQGGQPLPDQSKQIEQLLKRQDAQEGELRALKSGKDKAVARVETQTKDTLERYAKVLGIEPDKMQQARDQVILQDMLQAYAEGSQSETSSAGTGDESDSAIGEYVKQLGLDTNDKEIADAVAKNDYGALALKYADRQKNSTATAPVIDKGSMQSGPVKLTDAQLKEKIFGKQNTAFDADFAREHGGGVFTKG